MKHSYLITVMILACFISNVQAQENNDGEQLLIFQSNGIIDLFYTNEIDSIVLTDNSQIFYTKDTIQIVPFTQLDSVIVGNINTSELKAGVRELTDEYDLPWLICTETNYLHFHLNTPKGIIPQVGEKLFYGNSHQLLPTGLVAEVHNVSLEESGYKVKIKPLELKDIFNKFFYAGRIRTKVLPQEKQSVKQQAAEKNKAKLAIEGALNVYNYGEISSKNELEITGDYIIDIQSNYYHAHYKGELSSGIETKLNCNENTNLNEEKKILNIPLPAVAGVLYPSVYVNLFYDLNAEMNLHFAAKRVYRFEYDWSLKNGEQFGKVLPPTADAEKDDEITSDLTLNGDLYLGIAAGIDLNLIGNRLGFRFETKCGPFLKGELSIGLLEKMRNSEAELWHKANISSSARLQFSLSTLTHEIFYIFGEKKVTPFASLEFNLLKRNLDLFPKYEYTNAVATACSNNLSQTDIDIATAVVKPTYTEVESGFEIVDKLGNIVDSVFVGSIKPAQKHEDPDHSTIQTFDTTMPLSRSFDDIEMENYTIRPIFHYAGHTISAPSVLIKKDILLQPYIFTQSNGAMTFISNGPFVGYAKKDSTTYQIGSYLPTTLRNNIYSNENTSITQSIYINDENRAMLTGIWYGEDNRNFKIIINKDMSGEIDQYKPFTYEINTPQSGELLITFDDNETIIFRVISISNSELILKDKRKKEQNIITLTR